MPKFSIHDGPSRRAVIEYLTRLPDNVKRLDVVIKLHREKRTIPQNRLYRMWVAIIADETGNNPDDIHEVVKAMLLGVRTIEIAGIQQDIPISTTALNTVQFTHFLERLDAWAGTELGITLPHPEDAFWAEFEQRYGYECR